MANLYVGVIFEAGHFLNYFNIYHHGGKEKEKEYSTENY